MLFTNNGRFELIRALLNINVTLTVTAPARFRFLVCTLFCVHRDGYNANKGHNYSTFYELKHSG